MFDTIYKRLVIVFVLLTHVWQVSRLLDLIVNSLYSNKEVFLRELIRSLLSLIYTFFSFFCFGD